MRKITLLVALCATFIMNAQIFTDDFEAETADATTFANWTSVDVDADGEFFEVADIEAAATGAEASPLSGLVADSDSWEGTPFTPDNFLILTDPIDLTGIDDATLVFTMGTYQTNGTFIADRLQVYVSTSNDPAVLVTETPVFDQTVGDVTPADDGGANSGADITPIDLSSFAGQEVYIAFRHFDSVDENSVLIDNIVLDGTLSAEDFNVTNFTHFYNTVNSEVRLNASVPMQNVKVFNTLGQEVVNRTLSNTEETVSISNLSKGVYIAQVAIGNTTETFKFIKR
ncbi:hypothetical protein GCM10011344_29580 [Dokdonia pacifica]|uniref:Por secretion system C-terminal sorting domain-containing protein n=1 Tax=Dokdonia pacifica TaxID=1627892 RepID=A0A239C3S1_9FLAO|nr:choice-of-anchor J domain-containing protein [Dokdonia pacifica]GGG26870.1 hypothetical protein GCM10011344_29580 [Dokdonia pacifica]SNS14318.1 Por secretion system C-terminal sorting domain-containing protein [Dokdonia pacifica]